MIQSDFRSIEILFKKFSEPLPGSIDWTCFLINRTSYFRFFKTVLWLFQTSFSKVFQLFLSLSLSDLARLHSNFLLFYSSIFARFSSLKASKTILSLLFVLFSCFHAFFHAFRGYFRTSLFLGFLMIQGLFSEIDHWVLMGYCYIHDWCWLIWSIWGFMKN